MDADTEAALVKRLQRLGRRVTLVAEEIHRHGAETALAYVEGMDEGPDRDLILGILADWQVYPKLRAAESARVRGVIPCACGAVDDHRQTERCEPLADGARARPWMHVMGYAEEDPADPHPYMTIEVKAGEPVALTMTAHGRRKALRLIEGLGWIDQITDRGIWELAFADACGRQERQIAAALICEAYAVNGEAVDCDACGVFAAEWVQREDRERFCAGCHAAYLKLGGIPSFWQRIRLGSLERTAAEGVRS